MGSGEVQFVLIKTVPALQIAPVGKVQEHEVQDTGCVEFVDVSVTEPELNFLHVLCRLMTDRFPAVFPLRIIRHPTRMQFPFPCCLESCSPKGDPEASSWRKIVHPAADRCQESLDFSLQFRQWGAGSAGKSPLSFGLRLIQARGSGRG
jgi:hypothetical protein